MSTTATVLKPEHLATGPSVRPRRGRASRVVIGTLATLAGLAGIEHRGDPPGLRTTRGPRHRIVARCCRDGDPPGRAGHDHSPRPSDQRDPHGLGRSHFHVRRDPVRGSFAARCLPHRAFGGDAARGRGIRSPASGSPSRVRSNPAHLTSAHRTYLTGFEQILDVVASGGSTRLPRPHAGNRAAKPCL